MPPIPVPERGRQEAGCGSQPGQPSLTSKPKVLSQKARWTDAHPKEQRPQLLSGLCKRTHMYNLPHTYIGRKGGREGEEGREGGMKGGKEGKREGGRQGRERGRGEGRKGGREGGREGRDGGRKGGREEGREEGKVGRETLKFNCPLLQNDE